MEESTQPNQDKSRCLMLIKSKLQYKRINVDDSENPMVVIKIKTKKHEHTTIVGHYGQ